MKELSDHSLLSDTFKRPIALLWVNIIPQLILILINLKTYWYISNEVTPEGYNAAIILFSWQIFLIIIAGILLFFLHKQKAHINWISSLGLLITQIGYLWYAGSNLWQILPTTIEPWIVDSGNITLYQFTFIMPGIFYAGLNFATFKAKLKPTHDFIATLLTALFGPVLYYIFFMITGVFFGGLNLHLPQFISITFFIGFTLISLTAFVRLLVFAYFWIQKQQTWMNVTCISLVSLICPLAGLLLNRTIPFPADFQAGLIYIAAIFNGLILLIPVKINEKNIAISLFLKSLTFPFTLYFFLVFLPFLPLALPAMFIVGLGFLFLTPTVLFLIHSKKLVFDFKACLKEKALGFTLVISLIGALILPGLLLAKAFIDRGQLNKALNFVYSTSYKTPPEFKGSTESVQQILLTMKNLKESTQLPYISGIYNKIVFNGMVLSDKKIAYMYKLFSGEDISTANRSLGSRLLGRRSMFGGWGISQRDMPIQEKPRDVDITTLTVTNEAGKQITKARIKLSMHNIGSSNEAEFSRLITIPPGVIISDFKLKVGEELVEGRIFEKKTALWVYHMIRDFTRRDPGILTYKTPQLVEFNIYPFTQDQTRYAEIEMQYPNNFSPAIYIGKRLVHLNKNTLKDRKQPAIVQSPLNSKKTYAIIPKKILSTLPSFHRKPYLHFILDYSKPSESLIKDYPKRIEEIASQFKNAKKLKITAANLEIQDLTSDYIPIKDKETIAAKLKNATLTLRGGMDLSRVIKQQLLLYNEKALGDLTSPYQWQEYPIFIVISHENSALIENKDLDFFKPLLPDCNSFYISKEGSKFESKLLWDVKNQDSSSRVSALKMGERVAIISNAGKNTQMAEINSSTSQADFSVYDPLKGQFTPLSNSRILSDKSKYREALNLAMANYDLIYDPSKGENRLSDLVKSSRKLGVLIPATAYIIVERSSQWKILQEKEKQSLDSLSALEFSEEFETPAPGFLLLLILSMFLYKTRQGSYIKNGKRNFK